MSFVGYFLPLSNEFRCIPYTIYFCIVGPCNNGEFRKAELDTCRLQASERNTAKIISVYDRQQILSDDRLTVFFSVYRICFRRFTTTKGRNPKSPQKSRKFKSKSK